MGLKCLSTTLVLFVVSTISLCACGPSSAPLQASDVTVDAVQTAPPTAVPSQTPFSATATLTPSPFPPSPTVTHTLLPTSTPTLEPIEIPDADELSGELTLWFDYDPNGAETNALLALLFNARRKFKNLSIEAVQVPFGEIYNRYTQEVASGDGPDLFLAPNDQLGDMSRRLLLLPLDRYLVGKLEGVADYAIQGMTVDGIIYGIPESAKAVAIYYKKSKIKTPPSTTDDLLALVKQGEQVVIPLTPYFVFGWSTAFGGKLFDDDGKCIADQGGWDEFLRYLKDLKAAGGILESDVGKAESLFLRGGAAMFINGPWVLRDYQKYLGSNLAVALLPAGPEGVAAPLNGIDGFYINPNSQNPAAAVALALYLTSKDSAQVFTDKAGHVPVRSDVTITNEFINVFSQSSANGTNRPQNPGFDNFWGPFTQMLQRVIAGEISSDQGIKEACRALNR